MSHKHHRKDAPIAVSCAVLTISDSRTERTDESGSIIKEILTSNGHKVLRYEVIKDDVDAVRKNVKELLASPVDIIITNGGTGISKRDVTFEALSALVEKELSGFGEIFRYLSYKEIGASAILSRAFAGAVGDKMLICLPGSKNAVRLGLGFIVDELGHLVWETRK